MTLAARRLWSGDPPDMACAIEELNGRIRPELLHIQSRGPRRARTASLPRALATQVPFGVAGCPLPMPAPAPGVVPAGAPLPAFARLRAERCFRSNALVNLRTMSG